MNENTAIDDEGLKINLLVFETELESSGFPFYELIFKDNASKDEVFNHFLNSSSVPCKYLYFKDHFEDDEVQNGIKEANQKIPAQGNVASFVPQTDFEKKVHQVTEKFYSLCTNGKLDNKYYACSLLGTDLHESLQYISDSIRDFERKVLSKSEYNLEVYAETFTKTVIARLKKIDLPNLAKQILSEFTGRTESNEIEAASFLRSQDQEFSEEFGISINEAKANYRELKRNADVHFAVYLKIIESRIKIHSLFDFIDFLDANKNEYITTYLPLVDELSELDIERNQLKPDKNYKDKQQYNIVQKEIEKKFAPLYENVTQPILAKLQELGIWGGEKTYFSIYNSNTGAIRNFTENFVEEDIEKVKEYKVKYISFRSETNSNFLSLGFVFEKVDEVLKMLFDFFKDTDQNEFESFENKVIEVNSLADAVKMFSEGNSEHLKVVVKPKSEHTKEESNNSIPEISIQGFAANGLRESHEFKTTESEGGLPINFNKQKYFVYSIGLGAIFQTKELPCFDRKTKEDTVVKGSIYIPSFCKGFDEGKEYFKTNFAENRFQSNETIVSDLHTHYYHVNRDLTRWKDYVDMFPNILSENIAHKWGYYSGIVYSLNEFIELQPTLFKDFHKCNEPSTNVEVDSLGDIRSSDPSQVYERSIRIEKKADKETAKRLGCKEGDTYSTIPEPTSKAELFERFEKLNCQAIFEAHQRAFKRRHGKGNQKVIEDELKELTDFIERANALSTVDTFKSGAYGNEVEYSRLIYGYYQNKQFQNHGIHGFFEGASIAVYAKYVLYKKWLETKLLQFASDETNSSERFAPIRKASIVMEIRGENDWNTTSPVFHHIKGVLAKHSLTSKVAKEIMLDMKGMNSPEVNEKVIEPIIDYLERIDFNPNHHESQSNKTKKEEFTHQGESFNLDDFKFSPDVLLKSKEDFEIFLNQRYGNKYQSDQLNQIVDRYYGENTFDVRQEAQKKVDAKAYINSAYRYNSFKMSMEDSNSNNFHNTLLTKWKESHEKHITANSLQEVSNGLNSLFGSYLDRIFAVYRHAFRYHEYNSVRDMELVHLKRAEFDVLITEQTDFFIAHLANEKVAENYKMVLRRKDYALSLFSSIETFLANASINFNKSPFKTIFDVSKEKIENCISFDEVKFLAGQSRNKNHINDEPVVERDIVMYRFEDIFCNPDNAGPSLKALTQTQPPIVNDSYKYILGPRKKGSIAAWVEAMRQKGIIMNISDADLAKILNERITGLNLGADGRTLRNLGTTHYKKHYSNLLVLLP